MPLARKRVQSRPAHGDHTINSQDRSQEKVFCVPTNHGLGVPRSHLLSTAEKLCLRASPEPSRFSLITVWQPCQSFSWSTAHGAWGPSWGRGRSRYLCQIT